MGTESRYLAVDERVVCRVRRHPAILLRPFGEAVGWVIVPVFLGVLLSPDDGEDLLDTVFGLVTAFFILRFAWRVWMWSAARVVVTNRRIFEVSGIFSKRVASMPLTKVTDLTYHRSVFGRLLGYGAMLVETPGQKQALDMLSYIPNPDDFYRTVTSLVMAPTPRQREEVAEEVDSDETGPLPRVIV